MANLMQVKNQSTFVREIIDYISSRYPSADLRPGQVLRDLLVESPARYLGNTATVVNLVGQILNLDSLRSLLESTAQRTYFANALNMQVTEFDSMLTNIVELYASNFNLGRNLGSKSKGVLTIYSNTAPSSDVQIPGGTRVRIPNTQIVFKTLKEVTLTTAQYDTLNNRFYTNVEAECEVAGTIGDAPANSVTGFLNPIAGVQVTNDTRFTGGTSPESDLQLVDRIRLAYVGNFQGTAPSIRAKALSYRGVKDVTLAYLPNDPNKVRGGVSNIDVFVQGTILQQVTSQVTVQNALLVPMPDRYVSLMSTVEDTGISYTYPNVAFEPSALDEGLSVISFKDIPDAYIDSPAAAFEYYNIMLYLDTDHTVRGEFPAWASGSTPGAKIQAWKQVDGVRQKIPNTQLTFTGTATEQTIQVSASDMDRARGDKFILRIAPEISDVLSCTYSYDVLLSTIQEQLTSSASVFIGQDIQIYPATAVPIYADITVQVDQNYTVGAVVASVRSRLTELIGLYNLGAEINQSFLISEFLKLPGVVDIELPFAVFTVDSVTKTGSSDLVFEDKEYPIIDNVEDINIRGTTQTIGV